MRGGVGAQEELGAAAGGRRNECRLMVAALEDRQTVVMGPDTANQHMVAVIQQVMGGDRRRHRITGGADKVGGILGGNVLQHDALTGELLSEGRQVAMEEDLFAIKNIDLR